MPLPLSHSNKCFYYAHVARSQQCSLKLNEFSSHYSNAMQTFYLKKNKKQLCSDRIWVKRALLS